MWRPSATQQREDWIRSNERALHYYGGGVQVIIPANLRSAVSRSDTASRVVVLAERGD